MAIRQRLELWLRLVDEEVPGARAVGAGGLDREASGCWSSTPCPDFLLGLLWGTRRLGSS